LVVGVCEEGIKAIPALLPSVREAVRSRGSAVPMALTIGLGFALGEIWLLAWGIYHSDPSTARLPFYMLGGFIGERIFTIILHSFFILPALHGLLTGPGRFALGLAAGMLLHALVDVIAALYQMKLVGQEIAGLLVLAVTIGAAIPLYKYAKHRALLNRSALLSTSSRILYVRSEKGRQPQK
jgi:RsiW-degrading membrane proteinase PrsW (M82 family)